jgi:Uncharacterized protein conserved in bacteria (DUF2188)
MPKEKPTYVEKRGPGQYAVLKEGAERASAILPTQAAAVKRAKELSPNHKPHIARVEHTTKGKPDQFRK